MGSIGFIGGTAFGGRRTAMVPRMCSAPAAALDVISVQKTNGGAMVNCQVTKNSKVSKDSIQEVCGEDNMVDEETFAKYMMQYLIEVNQDLTNTEGLLAVEVFPVNYFSSRQFFQLIDGSKERLREMVTEGSA